MIASLGGLDAIVFTGGIGENVPRIREALCDQLAFLGTRLNTKKNAEENARAGGDRNLAEPDSTIPILVVHAEEEWEIARECWKLVPH